MRRPSSRTGCWAGSPGSRSVGFGVLVLVGPAKIFLSPLLILCTANSVLLGVVVAAWRALARHPRARQHHHSAPEIAEQLGTEGLRADNSGTASAACGRVDYA
ncbi:hypothetical protein ABGB07_08695 [Micromonosporaceae bacterium B7E4]